MPSLDDAPLAEVAQAPVIERHELAQHGVRVLAEQGRRAADPVLRLTVADGGPDQTQPARRRVIHLLHKAVVQYLKRDGNT